MNLPHWVAALSIVCRFGVGFVLLVAAIPKLFASEEFEGAVANYALLPPRVVPAAARAIPLLECCGALLMILGIVPRLAGTAVAALFAAFAAAITTNLVRGRKINCGCHGALGGRSIGWDLVAGDLLLGAAAAFAAAADSDVLVLWNGIGSAAPSAFADRDAVAIVVVAAIVIVGRTVIAAGWRLRRLAALRFPEVSS